MTFDAYDDDQPPMSDQLFAYYREVVATHANDPAAGTCTVCRVSKCQDWRDAVTRLLCAGEQPIAGLVLPTVRRRNGHR